MRFKAEVGKLPGYDAGTTGVVRDLKDAFSGMVS